MMNTLLATILALASFAAAGSTVKTRGEGKNVEDRGIERTQSSGSGAGASHAPGAGLPIPEALSKNIVWVAYPRLKDLPEKNGSHGVMRVPNKNVGWAVGFLTGDPPPRGEFRSGHCSIGESPKTPHHGACHRYLWIAAVPGGGPISSTCLEGPVGRHVTVNWVTYGPEAKKGGHFSHCELEPGRRYYCHYASAGFDRDDEDRPSNCDYTMGSPISYVPD